MLDSAFWKKYFKVYDALNLCIPYQKLIEEVVEQLKIKPGDLILDAGSGTGNLASEFKKRGARVIALDSSKEAIDIHLQKDKEAEVFYHDLNEKLNFPDNHFDKVVSINVLFFLDEKAKRVVVQEFFRVLKPEGKIILTNLAEGFKPFIIYLEHFKEVKKRRGFISAFAEALKLLFPSLKILYYANKIKRAGVQKQYLFKFDEQEKILKKTGFKNISESQRVYANQAVLNSATK